MATAPTTAVLPHPTATKVVGKDAGDPHAMEEATFFLVGHRGAGAAGVELQDVGRFFTREDAVSHGASRLKRGWVAYHVEQRTAAGVAASSAVEIGA